MSKQDTTLSLAYEMMMETAPQPLLFLGMVGLTVCSGSASLFSWLPLVDMLIAGGCAGLFARSIRRIYQATWKKPFLVENSLTILVAAYLAVILFLGNDPILLHQWLPTPQRVLAAEWFTVIVMVPYAVLSTRRQTTDTARAGIVAPVQGKGSPLCALCTRHPRTDTQHQLCQSCHTQYIHEIQRVRAQLYRAKRAQTPATLSAVEWIQTLQAFHFTCAYCQHKSFEAMDHIIPIAKGGGTTKDNCIPACTACNSRKHDTHPEKMEGSKK